MLRPYEAQKEAYHRLKEGLSLLPDTSQVDKVFSKFDELSETVEKCVLAIVVVLLLFGGRGHKVVYVSVVLSSHERELCGVREEVGKWWSGYEGATHWLGETEGDLITHKPLASSLDIIQRQKDSVQVQT